MRIGLTLPHIGPLASAEFVRDFAQDADQLGFASLWAVDHLAVPDRIESPYPLGEKPRSLPDGTVNRWMAPSYEQLSTLLFVAGLTRHARLGTSVSVLTLRNPVLHARMLATLDVYSGGRLVLGVGSGWLREEALAMQMPWDERGARAEEHVALLRALWTAPGDSVGFEGRFYTLPPVHPEPRPVQKPCPPIYVGGHGAAAIERAARIGDGWIAGPMTAERAATLVPRVREALAAARRDSTQFRFSLGASFAIQADPAKRIHHAVTPEGGVSISDPEEIVRRARAYQALGADELRMGISGSTAADVLAALQALAEHVLPAFQER